MEHGLIYTQDIMDFQTADEANDLLQNGIYVETSKGLVCMSLNDALSSSLNLSAEDLKNLATELILQQNNTKTSKDSPLVLQQVSAGSLSSIDSDDYTSECSDTNNFINANIIQPTVITVATLPRDNQLELSSKIPKLVSLVPVAVNLNAKLQPPIHFNADVNSSSENNVNSCISDSDASSIIISSSKTNLEEKCHLDNETAKPPTKRRGGWPKGRKRKPELLHLPPKAPATGYNLYLNEQRKLFKGSSLAFHEITKIIGNKWSSLSLNEKKPYLEKAEEEKKRYKEELRAYRQSDAYQLYLAKKRSKRAQYNVLSESDMDATDDFDEEDNEELYCRTCDQWFHNLHNKREHLQGRQHLQSVAGEMTRELGSDYDTDCLGNVSSVSFSTSLDESSLDAVPVTSSGGPSNKTVGTVSDSIAGLIAAITRREKDVRSLKSNVQESVATQEALYSQLCSLQDRESKLKSDLVLLKDQEKQMEARVFQLWQVPSWFIMDLSSTKPETASKGFN